MRSRYSVHRRYFALIIVSVFAILVVGWLTRSFVRAYVEIKHAHIFAMEVVADGWEAPTHALALDVAPDGGYLNFTRENSMYLAIGEVTEPTPVPQIPESVASTTSDIIPTEEPATGSSPPSGASGEPAQSDVLQETQVAPAETPTVSPFPEPESPTTPETPIPADTPPSTESPTSMGAVRSLAARIADELLARTATIAFATTSEVGTTTDALAAATSTEPIADEPTDVRVCSVLGTTCRSAEFSGFAAAGSMTDKRFKAAYANVSFAGIAPGELDNASIVIRYYHDGQWRDAGDVRFAGETSNATNSGYFSGALADVRAWDELADVRIMLEYRRRDEAAPVRAYVDAVWVDVEYQERAQDMLTGDAPLPDDAPENVAFTDTPARGDMPRALTFADGSQLRFPYTDALGGNALVFRTDSVLYAPSAESGATSTHAYVSITNVSDDEDVFRLVGTFPEGSRFDEVAQFMRNVPREVSVMTGEGTTTDTTTELRYVSDWVPVALGGNTAADIEPPIGYDARIATEPVFDIMPGQTIYLRVRFATEPGMAARFKLFAVGEVVAGELDSSLLRAEEDLRAAAHASERQVRKVELARAKLNEQLTDEREFAAEDTPSFRMRFHTQRSYLVRMRDVLTGAPQRFEVRSASLMHPDGAREDVPTAISYGDGTEWGITLEEKPRAFKPGRYLLLVEIAEGEETYTDTLEFYWGVLAVNTDKQPYAPGETAHLSLAALDDEGNTICDARLRLSITDPSGSVAEVPVSPGGSCGYNNVTDVPDYVADYPVGQAGTYGITLARLDDLGQAVTTMTDSFIAQDERPFTIARSGPTRIYPPSPYTMRLRVSAAHAFDGFVREAVPEGFIILDAGGAEISRADGAQYLSWPVSLGDGVSRDFSYTFKAPDVSPYLFKLGAATLIENGADVFVEPRSWLIASDALAIATGVAWLAGDRTTNSTELNDTTTYPFSWNIDSDYDSTYFTHSTTTNAERLTVNVAGDYLVAVTIPMERTDGNNRRTRIEAEVRVNGAKQDVGVSRSAYIRNATSHTESSDHLTVLVRNLQAGDYIDVAVHAVTTTNVNDDLIVSGRATLYAEYMSSSQTLFSATATTTVGGTNMNPASASKIIWYDGRKDTGYTHNNGSSPENVTLADTGYYLVFVNMPLSGAVSNANVRGRVLVNGVVATGGHFKQGYIENAGGDTTSSLHWSGVVQATTSNTVLSFDVQEEATSGTITVGTDVGSLVIQKLPSSDIYVASATSTVGGSNWNVSPASSALWQTDYTLDTSAFTHSTTSNAHQITVDKAGDYLVVLNTTRNAAITRANQITTIAVNGTERAGAEAKTHYIRNTAGHAESSGGMTFLLRDLAANDIISINTLIEANTGTVPEDQGALMLVWRKEAQSAYIQETQRWYANANSATTTDPWPVGATDLGEGDAMTTGTSMKSGDVTRLRIALKAHANTVASTDAFKLQYAAGSSCSPALSWTDVGAAGSGAIWRGYDNAGATAGSRISLTNTLLSVSATTQTYEEQNPSAAAPAALSAGQSAEWDWAIQNNGAALGTDYCFRMVASTGQVLKDYLDYPALITNGTPSVPAQSRLFDNEKVASTTPWFEFSSSDQNGEDIHYQVQVSTDPAFATTAIDKDSVTDFSLFSNVNTPADKAPFNSDETIRFAPTTALTNSTTYWWRVRAKDPNGTNTWSSWSSGRSFTIDTGVIVSTWFQTTQSQFDTDALSNTETTATGGGTVQLSGVLTSGTLYSPTIDYDDKTNGNSWGSVSWSDTEVGGTILYQVEYFASTSAWELVPNTEITGNSVGTTTPPIQLSGLDTGTYNQLRVKANFSRVSATPVLSDWAVAWGLSVSVSALSKLFDNEKTGTTTPSFEFVSSDPQGDDLVYQIEWSTDRTFATGVTTRTSDTNAGFVNTISGGDTSPFTHNNVVRFTVQAADALSNNTTYWWRVRAKDPAGGNAYSLWSDSYSFTVDTSVAVSTWFQTTTEQFATGILSRSVAQSGGVTVSTDVGKIAVYREATAADAITTTSFSHNFDTVVRQDDIYSMTASTSAVLKKGHYAVMYGARFDSTGGTNRSEIQSHLHLDGADLPAGWSQAFIRRNAPANEGLTSGGAIIYAAADGDELSVRTFRTDSNPTATAQRAANTAGMQLIRLDDTWEYARLSKSGKQTGPNSANWMTVTYDRQDELDTTAFAHTQGSGSVTLKSPGHYLIFANTYGSLNSGSTNTTVVRGRLILNGIEIDGSYSTVFTPGNTNTNGAYQGAVAIGTIIQSTTTNQVLSVQLSRAVGTAAWTINSNQSGTYVDRTGITIVKLPEGDFVRLIDTGTGNMNPTTLTAFTWNDEYEEDASFTHSTTTNTSRVTTNVAGDYLFLSALYGQGTNITNAYYNQGWGKNGGGLQQYGQGGAYSVNNTTADIGNWAGTIFPSMVNGDYAEVVVQAIGTTGTVPADKKGAQGVRISSLSEADPNVPTVESGDIVFSAGSGPKWASASWATTTPGSSSVKVQVLYASTTGYVLVPDSALPGNSTGFSTPSVDISNLNRLTYPTLRLRGTLTCAAGSCPTINDWAVTWSAGITISGTAQQFDQTTNMTSGTVGVAVNGVLQVGKTGTISGGTWSIPNVTVFTDDIITVFVSGAADSAEAVAITKYGTTGDITGMKLFERHLTLGSDDAPTLSNANIGAYDNSVSGSEDIFYDVDAGSDLTLCGISGCFESRLLVLAGTTYRPDSASSGNVTLRHFENRGTFVADGNTISLSGSWRNSSVFTPGTSSVVFTATSTAETVNSSGASSAAFSTITFGSGASTATWTLSSPLYASSTLSVNQGALVQSSAPILLSSNLSIGASGIFTKGSATTTFMGSGSNSWTDSTATKQDLGTVIIDGAAKTVLMGSNVKATDVIIGADDTLSANANRTLEVRGDFTNSGSFVAQNGSVRFTATAAGKIITPGASSFYDIVFDGSGGNWSFNTSSLSIGNDFTITTGTVTLPAATSTIVGSFLNTGGTFMHNNGTLLFTSGASETIRTNGSDLYDITMNGSGSWSFFDTNATTTRHLTIAAGTLTLPSGTFAVGGSFLKNAGSFTPNNGTLRFTAAGAQTVKLGGTNAAHITFAGAGSWTFASGGATTTGSVRFENGSVTLPTPALAVGGSLIATGGTFTHSSGLVRFTATSGGNTVSPGSSSFYDLEFASASGGWTITEHATSTRHTTLTSASSFTLSPNKFLSVGGTFTNLVGGSATTWATSTLVLTSGSTFALNTKTAGGDTYGTLALSNATKASMWNSSAATTTVPSTSSLYSQDHAGVDGGLYVWGAYTNTGDIHWSYATDFDGTTLSGPARRQASVRITPGGSVAVSSNAWRILGAAGATTTIDVQGSGSYGLALSGGTLEAGYYQIRNTDANGLALSGTPTVTALSDGDIEVSAGGGAAFSVAASVISQNPMLQIQRMRIATSTAISAVNVALTGTPTSYWWFRNHAGNLAGESYDTDPGGNPGHVRWDDSGYDLVISGHIYADHGTTPIGDPPCNGSAPAVKLVVDRGATYTTSCNGSGMYSFPSVTFSGDATFTVFLDTAGGKRAATVTRTPTASITDLDLYENAVIVRHEDIAPLSIAQLAWYDATRDSDIPYIAATSTTDTLTVHPDTELVVWGGKTFTPAGNVTLASGGSGSARDGRLFIMPSGAFVAAGTQSHALGGGWYIGTSSVFTTASTTITLTATTTGKSLYAAVPLSFHDLVLNGAGGGWSLDSMISATTTVWHSLAASAGTLSGTGGVVVKDGGITGNGVVSMTGGAVVLEGTGSLANTVPWQFYDLTLGAGASGALTKTGTATTTIARLLSLASGYTLNAGSGPWVLTGAGTPFVVSGTFSVQTAPFWYTASAATNVRDTTYAALFLAPAAAGTPTYTIQGGTFATGNLVVGGVNPVVVTANTNDPAVAVGGMLRVNSGSTFVASNVGAFEVGGSWDMLGTFTHSSGLVRFTATSGGNQITPGSSSFYDLEFASGSGGWTINGNATSTRHTTLTSASSFTLSPDTFLSVGGTFTNLVGGSATTWATSTLVLTSGSTFALNTKTAGGDTYGTLALSNATKASMWNSSAATTTVPSTSSLYSQDHAGVDGALNIWGAYTRSSGSDYWSYATDFDGTDISGTPRAVDVRIASSSSVSFTGGLLDIIGAPSATTTIRNQGNGFFGLSFGGGTLNASYYSIRDIDATGLALSGTPTITSLSDGDLELSYPGGSLMTIAGSVITANPLKIVQRVRFATTTPITGTNVTATGSTASSWKFNLHYGNLDGEYFDADPTGDPGYLRWDDSASAITVAGHVYSGEGSGVSSVCDGSTQNVRLKVQGAGTYTSSCDGSGEYAILGVTFNPGDTLTVFLDGASAKAATVSVDPVSNIGDMDLYEHRVIVRHEDTAPLSIADMTQYDADQDVDIPFDATDAATDTLVLPPDTKLIVWGGKTFAPAGNATLESGGSGASYDGTLELKDNAVFSAAGTQSHAIGGSLVVGSGASIVPASATFTFTATTTGKTISFGPSGVHNATFNGAGGNWSFTTPSATTTNDFTITAGTLTMPTATTTIGGSFSNAGTFMHNNGVVAFISSTTETVQPGSSAFYDLFFDGTGGAWSFGSAVATSSRNMIVKTGTVTLPSSLLVVGGSFVNTGAFVSGTNTVRFTATAAGKVVQVATSTFYNLSFDGAGGEWAFLDARATTTRDFTIVNGSTTLPSTELAVGGSFTNAGAFISGTSMVKLTATTTGKTIQVSGSPFYDLRFDSSAGGWTIVDSATSTHDTVLARATSFTLASGQRLAVGGSFQNQVGGAATTWTGSTLYLYSGTSYSANEKTVSDTYATLALGPLTHVRTWNSSASSVSVPSNASLYSQDHAGVDGALNIWGAYTRSSGSDYWSYATDFDGAALGGSSRAVSVSIASSSVVTFQSSGALAVVGGAGATTTIANQGSGFYSFAISGGTLNASRYSFRNLFSSGIDISGSPTITSLSNGDLELSYPGGSLITVAGSAIDANASQAFTGMRFATSTGITGYNVTRTGSPVSAWSFSAYHGNLGGEAFDSDGGDACGAIRWSDSACLFVSQEHFRWRADDGGVGVPDAEWYDSNWSKRMRITIENPNVGSYTDVPVKVVIDYDSDMRSDFADLRFTDASGTTTISYWSESTIASASTTMWVKVPSLLGASSAVIYVYYGNASASSAESGSNTFTFFEDFEGGTLSGYSGDTSLFSVGTTYDHNHTYGLDAGSNFDQKTTNGIYKTGSLFAQGSTIRFFQYVDATQEDEPCTLFGVQASGQNYAVCLDRYPGDAVRIAENVTSNDGSGTVLASTSVTYATGWYEVVIDWLTSNLIDVKVYDSVGSLFANATTSDSSYTSGGMGFSFWFMHGGWDFYTARPYLPSTPTYAFGGEQVSGGASWSATEDADLSGVSVGAVQRLRFSVQNTGSTISGRSFRLQVAPLGSSLSCEAVPFGTYSDVPTETAGCGTAVACMTTSTQFTDQTAIADLLSMPGGMAYTNGRASEDPSNESAALTVPGDTATELEYAFKFTTQASASAYCLRVSDGGASLDNYQNVPQATLLHAPFITALTFNDDDPIALTEGATTSIAVSATVTDYNGYADMVSATSTYFRSGVGAMCTVNDNNCYRIATTSCLFSSCAGNSCTLSCTAPVQYLADPTDTGTYAAHDWLAQLAVRDSTDLVGMATSTGVDLLTLYALRIDTPDIDFGDLAAGADTGSFNAQTTMVNTGNTPIGIQVSGTDLSGTSSSIPVGQQKYATSTFAYGTCSICQFLTGSATNVDISLAKPTSTSTPVTDELYWGLNVPVGTRATTHQGTNTFIATAP